MIALKTTTLILSLILSGILQAVHSTMQLDLEFGTLKRGKVSLNLKNAGGKPK